MYFGKGVNSRVPRILQEYLLKRRKRDVRISDEETVLTFSYLYVEYLHLFNDVYQLRDYIPSSDGRQ
jgi:hypothetical protein